MSYSVKEAANLSGMTIRTLRYYDEIELLPIERNTSNHRVYDMHDILKLSMIRSLKEIGISLEDIKDILKNNTKSMDDSLLLQEQLLDIKINNLKKQKEKVRLMISQRKQHKSIEEVLLNEYIDFERLDIKNLYEYIDNRHIDFDYFFERIYRNSKEHYKAEKIMAGFIEFLNEEYHGYFTEDNLKELAETYKTEKARLYFSKYEKDFHLYLSNLVTEYIQKRND